MEKKVPSDLSEPYRSRRSFDYTEEETAKNINRLIDAKEFNEKVLPRLMGLEKQ